MDRKGTTVIYIDAAGVSHEALVFAFNALHTDLLSVAYIDKAMHEGNNIVKKYDVAHVSTKDETNPDLPVYPLNAWKDYYEDHQIIPPDHPNFDHQFKLKDLAQNGQPIPVSRPITEAVERRHQESLTQEDADELKALSGTGGMAAQPVTTTEGLQTVMEGITGAEDLPAGIGPKYPTIEDAVIPEVVDHTTTAQSDPPPPNATGDPSVPAPDAQ